MDLITNPLAVSRGGSPRANRAWPSAWSSPSGPLGWQRSPGSTARRSRLLTAADGRCHARNVPHLGTVRTSPSAARTRSTLVIVAWETW